LNGFAEGTGAVENGPLGVLNMFVSKGLGTAVAVLLLPPNIFAVVGTEGNFAKQMSKKKTIYMNELFE
jgi:hypothetical protein